MYVPRIGCMMDECIQNRLRLPPMIQLLTSISVTTNVTSYVPSLL